MRKHPEAKCESCPLQFTGTYVPSEIPKEGASIAIVGEAPGYYEAQTRKPFVGPSGQLLDKVLQSHDINRKELLITNAVSCRHPNGDNPESAEVNACRPRLLSELQTSAVDKALATGNVANEALLDKVGVNKLRIGQGRKCSYDNSIRVLSTLHPAAVLRAPDQINYFQIDVGKLKQEPIEWKAPAFVVANGEEDALSLLTQLIAREVPKIAVDIETDIDKDEDFGQPNQMELLCVGIAYYSKKVLVVGYEACKSKRVMQKIATLINSTPNVVFQNGKFDQKGLFPLCGFVKMTSDTQLMSYTLNEYSGPMKPHSLEFMGREYVGAPDWKHELDQYNPKKYGYGVIPKGVLYRYNAYDCDITYEVEGLLRNHLQEQGLVEVHNMLVQFSQELMYVEMNGIGVNKDHLATLRADFDKQLEKQQIALEACLPVLSHDLNKNYQPKSAKKSDKRIYNPGSPNQTIEVLKDFGAVVQSSDENHLLAIIERRTNKPIAEFCKQLLIYRGVAKQRGTYVDGIEKRMYAGRVYTSFLLHGTTNGRLSSRNPNLQNIPRRKIIRDLFVPVKPENCFVQADYSQAELRILGWLAGDSYFLPIFKEGVRDVFDELTKELFPGRTKQSEGAEQWKELRSKRVKPFVYGLAYGRTEYGLAADPELGMSVDEAKVIMKRFLKLIPEIVEWQEWIKKEVRSGRDLISPFGRHRRFPLLTEDKLQDTYREALSFLPSSTSSDIGLNALCNVRRELKGVGWVRNFVHDSILVECHREDVEKVSEVLERRMLEAAADLTTDVTFKVDLTVGNSWGEC